MDELEVVASFGAAAKVASFARASIMRPPPALAPLRNEVAELLLSAEDDEERKRLLAHVAERLEGIRQRLGARALNIRADVAEERRPRGLEVSATHAQSGRRDTIEIVRRTETLAVDACGRQFRLRDGAERRSGWGGHTLTPEALEAVKALPVGDLAAGVALKNIQALRRKAR
ncbi:MAG: hypothetical protein ACTHU0_21635 [Kofleriaceae bacterium]